MEYEESLATLKFFYKVKTNKELSEKMGISEDTVKQWGRKKNIPSKYINMIKNQSINNSTVINGNGNINHINISNGFDNKVCELIKQLPEKRQEYYYHLIKAELINLDK